MVMASKSVSKSSWMWWVMWDFMAMAVPRWCMFSVFFVYVVYCWILRGELSVRPVSFSRIMSGSIWRYVLCSSNFLFCQ